MDLGVVTIAISLRNVLLVTVGIPFTVDLKTTRCGVMSVDERHLEAEPTGAERLGDQPGQAAGDLGPGEVVMVEAPDGRDDEGPSHPPVIRSISHLLRSLGNRLCEKTRTHARTHPGGERGNGADFRNSSGLRLTSRPEEFDAVKSVRLSQEEERKNKNNVDTWPRLLFEIEGEKVAARFQKVHSSLSVRECPGGVTATAQFRGNILGDFLPLPGETIFRLSDMTERPWEPENRRQRTGPRVKESRCWSP